jgi:hypothetical protein
VQYDKGIQPTLFRLFVNRTLFKVLLINVSPNPSTVLREIQRTSKKCDGIAAFHKLRTLCVPNSRADQLHLRDQFQNLVTNPDESISSFTSKFSRGRENLANAGIFLTPVDEVDQYLHCLRTDPDSLSLALDQYRQQRKTEYAVDVTTTQLTILSSSQPSSQPSLSSAPSSQPSSQPSLSSAPSSQPSSQPSLSSAPSSQPSSQPSLSSAPSSQPRSQLSLSSAPSSQPSALPSVSAVPSSQPSSLSSSQPSVSSAPSSRPSSPASVSSAPSSWPSSQPSFSSAPISSPSTGPSVSSAPSSQPSALPSISLPHLNVVSRVESYVRTYAVFFLILVMCKNCVKRYVNLRTFVQ